MSLKGYEFLSEDNKRVVARYFFKNETLYLCEKISDERLQEIKDYITKNGMTIYEIKDKEW